MHGELSERGRVEWHRESCRAMVESTGHDHARDPENAWRIKGAGRLTRRQLAYLRELWRWRDQHARSANLPAFKVLGNQEILGLVRWAESHPGVPLHQGPKLPRNITRAPLTTLQEAIARVVGMDEAAVAGAAKARPATLHATTASRRSTRCAPNARRSPGNWRSPLRLWRPERPSKRLPGAGRAPSMRS